MQPVSHCDGGQSAEAGHPATCPGSLSPRVAFVQPLVWQLFTLLFRTGLRSPHIHHWHANTGYPCLSTPVWPVYVLTTYIHWKYSGLQDYKMEWSNGCQSSVAAGWTHTLLSYLSLCKLFWRKSGVKPFKYGLLWLKCVTRAFTPNVTGLMKCKCSCKWTSVHLSLLASHPISSVTAFRT